MRHKYKLLSDIKLWSLFVKFGALRTLIKLFRYFQKTSDIKVANGVEQCRNNEKNSCTKSTDIQVFFDN